MNEEVAVAVSQSKGAEMHAFASRLFPICRSITGNGVRETLRILSEKVPLEIREVPSGKKVFDWEVPLEWNITEAYIKDSKGRRVIDFADSNLHVLNYSTPIHQTVSIEELRKHLSYLEEQPDLIPYRTSYYKKDWGFCVTYNQFKQLNDPSYEVCIASTLEPGSLTYGEYFIPGEVKDEVLISAHVCHPSLANDNLSGLSVVSWLAETLSARSNYYSYRFIFIPGTIGAITWLAENEERAHGIRFGLVASLLGDQGPFTFKRSRRGDTEIDQIVEYVLKARSERNKIIDFFPYGYDERQFCSPGFNLAVGCLSRTPFGQYPEYHTSADNLDLIKPASLEEAYDVYLEILTMLDQNRVFINTNPKCEPQLGKRGLYSLKGGNNDAKAFQMALLWTLNLTSGENSLFDIARRSQTDFKVIREAAMRLEESGLLVKAAAQKDA
jgi:aminopeptidase-like protein